MTDSNFLDDMNLVAIVLKLSSHNPLLEHVVFPRLVAHLRIEGKQEGKEGDAVLLQHLPHWFLVP